MTNNIYNISNKELKAIKEKIKGCSIIKISWFDGWRYALKDNCGLISIKCLNVCKEVLRK